jgi:hypothetical protein
MRGTAPAKLPYLNSQGRKFIGTGSIDFGNIPSVSFAGVSQQTVFTELFIPDTSTATGYIFGRVSSSWDYHLMIDAPSQQFTFATGGNSTGVKAPAASTMGGLTQYQGRRLPVAGIYDKVNSRIYVDGVQVNSLAQTSSFPSTTDPFAIGARGGGGQASASGIYVGIVLLFKRVLSDVEIASLSANPWQLFASPYDAEEFASAAAAPTVTFAGNSVAPLGSSGSLFTAVRLGGMAAAQPMASGVLSTSVPLTGAAQAVAMAVGALAANAIGFAGSAAAPASASGGLTTAIGLAGTSITQASANGVTVTSIRLAGSTAAKAAASGVLATGVALRGAASAVASAVGLLGSSADLPAGVVDVSLIALDRIVVFEGSGSRVVVFEGSGSRVVIFDGSGNRVRFEQMNASARVPTKVGDKWTVDRDPDEISYYAADITQELLDRNTTADSSKIVPVLFGVALLDGPQVQVAMIDGVQRTFVVVKLGGVDDPPDDWRWVARVPCVNGERFDKTTWFNKVDP